MTRLENSRRRPDLQQQLAIGDLSPLETNGKFFRDKVSVCFDPLTDILTHDSSVSPAS